jgi:hypothetical protein
MSLSLKGANFKILYDKIFIYCDWVSTRWQWWVNLYKNRKETGIYKRRNNTQNNTKTKNTKNLKQTYKTRKQT